MLMRYLFFVTFLAAAATVNFSAREKHQRAPYQQWLSNRFKYFFLSFSLLLLAEVFPLIKRLMYSL